MLDVLTHKFLIFFSEAALLKQKISRVGDRGWHEVDESSSVGQFAKGIDQNRLDTQHLRKAALGSKYADTE